MRRLLSITEVSEALGLPVATLHQQRRRNVGAGALALKIGRHLKWRPDDLERWLEEQRERPRAESPQ